MKKKGGAAPNPSFLNIHLIESIPDMLVYTDLKGIILTASRQVVLQHGYRRVEELIGKSVSNLVVPEERETVRKSLERILKTVTLDIDHNLIRKDGTRFPAEVSLSLVRDDAGKPCGIVSIARDISDRMKAEAALRESEARHRQITQLSVDYFFRVDISPDGTPAVAYVSENITNITGRRQDQITGFDQWINIIHPDDRERFISFYRTIASGGQAGSLECRSFLTTGAMRWINVSVYPMLDSSSGRVVSILGTVKDITGRKLAEERIMASLREKETLLKEIHHRVKNNMQVIVSLLNLQAQYLDNVELVKYFIEAENRIRSMALVHEKLYQSEDLGHIDFSLYLSELTNTIMYSYSSTSRAINMSIDALPVHLPVDQAIPVGLLITELLTNTIKYAFPAGWEGIPEVRIFLRERDDMVELSISDNGVGLPKNTGIGEAKTLGLSLVPMLAGQINGTVSLDRSHGTAFIITFRKA